MLTLVSVDSPVICCFLSLFGAGTRVGQKGLIPVQSKCERLRELQNDRRSKVSAEYREGVGKAARSTTKSNARARGTDK